MSKIETSRYCRGKQTGTWIEKCMHFKMAEVIDTEQRRQETSSDSHDQD